MSHRRVLVVGTTADYIDLISERYPGRALFVTDERERATAAEPAPPEGDEILVDLGNAEETLALLSEQVKVRSIEPSGVTCFDCESMALASRIARELSLPYPSEDAVAICRSKFASKVLWQEAGVDCPKVELVRTLPEAVSFLDAIGGPLVLKPLTGSGSELVFKCRDRLDCSTAFNLISSRLAHHPNERMYVVNGESGKLDPRRVFAAEEFIRGREYSCDFVLDGGRVEIIRIAKKIPAVNQPLGTTMAYVLPATLPGGLSLPRFRDQLKAAAEAVGLDRAIIMVDFIVRNGRALLIEMTPRPGGDCLPPLLRHSSGFDILGFALDFAEGKPLKLRDSKEWKRLAGVRLFATSEGVIRTLDASRITDDGRVLECYLKRSAGHRVILPPQDYDSRVLGHVIFEPLSAGSIEGESAELSSMLNVEMEPSSWVTSNQS